MPDIRCSVMITTSFSCAKQERHDSINTLNNK
nr:MAG TPA: hypothetical protein [Bacteriophage sp.]DAU54883.1 MAG TPA: hypothetical protein [Caudoviricetes sp.]